MPELRYPSMGEFWQRLERRRVDADLRTTLHQRVSREGAAPTRLPAATVAAVASRLLPGAVPPDALAVFLDEHFDRQLGRADDKAGVLPRSELIPAGFAALDDAAGEDGQSFADLDPAQQDALLARAERGDLNGPDGFDSATWFKRTRGLLFLGYGSDPRGMVDMGFPGPSYEPGHVWLDEGEVASRAARKVGYLTL